MEYAAEIAALLTACCTLPYLRDALRGRTRPHRVSWGLFALLSVTAAVAQYADGNAVGAWLATGAAVGFGVVFAFALRPGVGVGGCGRLDRACLAIGLGGVAVALLTGEPMAAVAGTIAAEWAGAVPTIRKGWHQPQSETLSTWLMDAAAGGIAILAVSGDGMAAWLYPAHHALVNLCVAIAILAGRRGMSSGTPLAASTGVR